MLLIELQLAFQLNRHVNNAKQLKQELCSKSRNSLLFKRISLCFYVKQLTANELILVDIVKKM